MSEKERLFEVVASGQTNRIELMKQFPQHLVDRYWMCALRRCRK